MQLSSDELRSLLHNVISCYRDHVNVYHTANPEDEAVNDVMAAAQQSVQADICPRCEGTGKYQRLGFEPTDCALCNGTGKCR